MIRVFSVWEVLTATIVATISSVSWKPPTGATLPSGRNMPLKDYVGFVVTPLRNEANCRGGKGGWRGVGGREKGVS
jgi:hypothetical protein